ncbi:MAG: DNA circularization N-terminal domain-containing protein [Desulfovibrionaceae bacterium]
MDRKENYRAASFRGVPFFVESADLSGGRRSVVHEFPQRDDPFVEDLGRKPREIGFEAFVLGPDHAEQRDRLLDALESSGPGQLVHPFHGSVRVACTGFRLREGKASLGMAVFSLSFVRSGEPGSPSSEADTVSMVGAAADNAVQVSGSALDSLLDLRGPSFVLSSAHATAMNLAAQVRSVRAAVGDAALFAVRTASVLSTDLAGFASAQVSGLLSPLWQTAGDALPEASACYAELRSLSGMLPSVPAPLYPTPGRLREQSNASALTGFAERMAVAEMARAASRISPESTSAAVLLREQVTVAIDGVLDRSGDDDVFQAFSSLRAQSVRDLAARARFAPMVAAVTPPPESTALNLTHASLGSISELEDVVRRNRIRHPGFPGGDPVEVLRAARA